MSAAQNLALRSFRDVVDELYVHKRVAAITALALVHGKSGVSLGALWSAYRGYRVNADTAQRLVEWAYAEHGIEDLDELGMLKAPPRPRRVLK